jgi:hypothetical protein
VTFPCGHDAVRISRQPAMDDISDEQLEGREVILALGVIPDVRVAIRPRRHQARLPDDSPAAFLTSSAGLALGDTLTSAAATLTSAAASLTSRGLTQPGSAAGVTARLLAELAQITASWHGSSAPLPSIVAGRPPRGQRGRRFPRAPGRCRIRWSDLAGAR